MIHIHTPSYHITLACHLEETRVGPGALLLPGPLPFGPHRRPTRSRLLGLGARLPGRGLPHWQFACSRAALTRTGGHRASECRSPARPRAPMQSGCGWRSTHQIRTPGSRARTARRRASAATSSRSPGLGGRMGQRAVYRGCHCPC